jgi:hypothetical protein
MWSIKKPSLCKAKSDIEKAFPKINDSERKELISIYTEYDKNNGKPNNKFKSSFKIPIRKAYTIKNAYKRLGKDKDLQYIRAELIENAQYKCAFCGDVNSTLTLDHYLGSTEL